MRKLLIYVVLLGAAGSVALGQTITIGSTPQQTIDGFGGAAVDTTLSSGLPTSLADFFFRSDTGIGLSIVRLQVVPTVAEGNSWFTTTTGYGYNATCVGNTGGACILSGELAVAQQAQARGVSTFFASQWSPTGSLKSSGSWSAGGNLIGNATNYAALGTELASYVTYVTGQGIPLVAVGIQNEPDITQSYPSCLWTAQQFHDAIPYIYSAFGAAGVSSTLLMIPENSYWSSTYDGLAATAMTDGSVSPDVGIMAQHGYGGDSSIGAVSAYGKKLWLTEDASQSSTYDGSISDALTNATHIHQFLTVAGVNAYVAWFLTDEQLQGYGTDNSSLTDSVGNIPLRAYALGNWAKFVRPGWHMVNVTNSTGLMVSAFQDPTSTGVAIVVVNTGSSASQAFAGAGVGTVTPWITSSTYSLASQSPVTVSGGSFTYTIPASSVTTFYAAPVSSSYTRRPIGVSVGK